jgi:DNA-binding NarL/FixJ family response regulator
MTKIAIVEDNPTVRQTLCEWINSASDCRCVCACATGKAALAEIPGHQPDVVLMDINLPGESGITCTARLKQILPKLQIVMLTVYKDHDLILQALKAGASGYLLKRSGRQDILKAIGEVRTGGAPMTGEIARMLVETFQKPPADEETEGLTARELEILTLLAKGLSNKEISARLGISFETVRNHLRHIYDKLHVHCRTEAVMKYLKSSPASSTGS